MENQMNKHQKSGLVRYSREIGVRRFTKQKTVNRFNVFAEDSSLFHSNVELHRSILSAFSCAVFRQYPPSRFVCILDIHSFDPSKCKLESAFSEFVLKRDSMFVTHKNATSVWVRSSDFLLALLYEFGLLRDGDVYLRFIDGTDEGDNQAMLARIILQSVPKRSERSYVDFLPLYHTVSIFESQSLFIGFFSQDSFFTGFEEAIQNALDGFHMVAVGERPLNS